jgi:hypothetical protein
MAVIAESAAGPGIESYALVDSSVRRPLAAATDRAAGAAAKLDHVELTHFDGSKTADRFAVLPKNPLLLALAFAGAKSLQSVSLVCKRWSLLAR